MLLEGPAEQGTEVVAHDVPLSAASATRKECRARLVCDFTRADRAHPSTSAVWASVRSS